MGADMKYLKKHLFMELLENKRFVTLLLILSSFTSFMYFFVHFSIDGNLNQLNAFHSLTENQILYKNGMISNGILARNILTGFLVLTGFVFVLFYYRFIQFNKCQLGCLKALGFHGLCLTGLSMAFTAFLSLLGAILGLIGGFFASDILIQAGEKTYFVSETVKRLNGVSFVIGFFLPGLVFTLITCLPFLMIHRKEISLLLSDSKESAAFPITLKAADKISSLFPPKYRLSTRLAFRKPIILLLLLLSVFSFSVLFILAYSLNLSSETVIASQTEGRFYSYDTCFPSPQLTPLPAEEGLSYLDAPGFILGSGEARKQTIVGLEKNKGQFFQLLGCKGEEIEAPQQGEIIISKALHDLYGFSSGQRLTIQAGGGKIELTISAIAFNAQSNCVYIQKAQLAEMLSLPEQAYTGFFSMENNLLTGMATSSQQRLEALQRDMVSNQTSAVINQVIGCLIGCIFLYLALLFHFQDSTEDILILHKIGYSMKEIRKLLIDIYKPILLLFFLLTLWPAIALVKGILRSLSIQIGDYMPFQTNGLILLGIFMLFTCIYYFVQFTFHWGIKKML